MPITAYINWRFETSTGGLHDIAGTRQFDGKGPNRGTWKINIGLRHRHTLFPWNAQEDELDAGALFSPLFRLNFCEILLVIKRNAPRKFYFVVSIYLRKYRTGFSFLLYPDCMLREYINGLETFIAISRKNLWNNFCFSWNWISWKMCEIFELLQCEYVRNI